jgi:hypothetical protein
MSSVATNPTHRAHRAQIVAEAVVSAYIHEIAPTGARARASRCPRPSRKFRVASAGRPLSV